MLSFKVVVFPFSMVEHIYHLCLHEEIRAVIWLLSILMHIFLNVLLPNWFSCETHKKN